MVEIIIIEEVIIGIEVTIGIEVDHLKGRVEIEENRSMSNSRSRSAWNAGNMTTLLENVQLDK